MKASPLGRAWIELDMNNLRHNINVLRGLLPKGCQLMPAVKANAYGHGAVAVAKELNANGIRAFCVASALEGVELRKHGIKGGILVLGYTHPNQFFLLRKYRLTQTVIDYAYAQALERYGRKLTVHIKVDTGMNRLGERWENTGDILRIFKCKNLRVDGIYTHLCAAGSDRQADQDFTQRQINHFRGVLSKIQEQGFPLHKVHVQGSYGVFNRPDVAFDYARVGIALYGMLSTTEDTARYHAGLRPVLSVKARVGAVKTLRAGEAVGYGCAFTAPHPMSIAALAIGYADGIPRCLSCGVGHALIYGQKAPVVGLICMDQMMVDITGIQGIRQGDIAVIIGQSGEAEITACEIAEQAGTIANEIVSRLGERLRGTV